MVRISYFICGSCVVECDSEGCVYDCTYRYIQHYDQSTTYLFSAGESGLNAGKLRFM